MKDDDSFIYSVKTQTLSTKTFTGKSMQNSKIEDFTDVCDICHRASWAKQARDYDKRVPDNLCTHNDLLKYEERPIKFITLYIDGDFLRCCELCTINNLRKGNIKPQHMTPCFMHKLEDIRAIAKTIYNNRKK